MNRRAGLLVLLRGRAARWGGSTVSEDREHDGREGAGIRVAAAAGRVQLALPPQRGDRAGRRAAGRAGHGRDPAGAAADHRRRHRDAPGVDLAAGRAAAGRGRGELHRHLPAPVPRWPGVAGRPARPADRAVRLAVPAGRRAPGRDPHRAAGRPVHLRPEHGAGHHVHGPGHAREHRAVRGFPGHHGRPVPRAHPGDGRGGARAVDDRARVPAQAVPRELGRAAAVRRGGRPGRRGHRRRARGQRASGRKSRNKSSWKRRARTCSPPGCG